MQRKNKEEFTKEGFIMIRKKILGLIVAVTLFTAVPAGISLSTARDVQAAETYTVNSPVSRFRDADSAATGEGSVGTYPTGTYYIYKTYGGMVNISKTPGQPGSWINPSEN